jgi:hypothetical protein
MLGVTAHASKHGARIRCGPTDHGPAWSLVSGTTRRLGGSCGSDPLEGDRPVSFLCRLPSWLAGRLERSGIVPHVR